MSTFPRAVAARADRCYIGLPKWLWSGVVAPIVVSGAIAVFAWVWDTDRATEKHDAQLKALAEQLGEVRGELKELGGQVREVLNHVKQL